MLTREEDVVAVALAARGRTVSAIARPLDRDRKTIRSYLTAKSPGSVLGDRGDPGPEATPPWGRSQVRAASPTHRGVPSGRGVVPEDEVGSPGSAEPLASSPRSRTTPRFCGGRR